MRTRASSRGSIQSRVQRTVALSTGYEVDLAEKRGLDHLWRAVTGESIERVRGSDAAKKRGWLAVLDQVFCELHFVAGQLLAHREPLTIADLIDGYGPFWDRLHKKPRKVQARRSRTAINGGPARAPDSPSEARNESQGRKRPPPRTMHPGRRPVRGDVRHVPGRGTS